MSSIFGIFSKMEKKRIGKWNKPKSQQKKVWSILLPFSSHFLYLTLKIKKSFALEPTLFPNHFDHLNTFHLSGTFALKTPFMLFFHILLIFLQQSTPPKITNRECSTYVYYYTQLALFS